MDPASFDNSYARLPQRFYARQAPVPVAAPGPIRVNRELAAQLGIDADWLASEEGTQVLAGNAVPPGAEPIATVYAGHQFGGFNPQLGDGRAILLGEVLSPDGKRFDLQLKGSGPTPYSRGGDGRSPLGPVLREYIVSEAMYRLGVPTTRALAAVSTGDTVARDRFLPGAVLARVASSHIRIGTFEYFAARRDTEALQLLAHHVIERHYPEAQTQRQPGAGAARRGDCPAGAADRAVATAGFYSRRDEHGQYAHLRRNHRLRPLRLHGPVQPGPGIQLDRPWRALCLPQTTGHRPLEPVLPGPGAAADSA